MIRHWRTWTTQKVVVSLKSGAGFSGVLWAQRGPLLILRQADYHQDGQSRPVDGEVVVQLADVEFVQVVT